MAIAAPLTAGSHLPGISEPGRRREDDVNLIVTHALTAEGHDASEDGTGRGTPLVAAVTATQGDGGSMPELSDVPSALRASQGGSDKAHVLAHTTGYQGDRVADANGIFPALNAQGGNNGGGPGALLRDRMVVRRLLPVECCRLQGFPDDHLNLDPPLADSAKYRMLGNSFAVPVVAWILKRLVAVTTQREDVHR